MPTEDLRKLEEEARRLGIQPWQLEMMKAVPHDQVRDLVNDFRRGPAAPSSLAADKQEVERPARVAVDIPLAPPPGVALCDLLVDAQDAKDRRHR